jgi:antitoxin component of RelBE/YafQ-DinJ toxin-antitoxin module
VEEEIVDIRIRLAGEVKDRFQKIKRRAGLTNNTEVVRLVINYYYEKNFMEAQGFASEKARA